MLAKKALSATAGAPKLYVEDVMSCFLYTGNGSTQTITNNIDLSGKGGAVWSKQRTGVASSHVIVDTVRGVGKTIYPDSTTAEFSGGSPIQTITAFNNNGYSLGTNANFNRSGDNFVSWTFRKAEKFFDVVTYTGNGASNRWIDHSLTSVPGAILIKRVSGAGEWNGLFRKNSTDHECFPATAFTTSASDGTQSTSSFLTSTQFQVGTAIWPTSPASDTNANGATYVAYLFAHDAGGFGDAGSDSIIKCGSFTTNGSGNATVTLDWEPQWLMFKKSSSTGDWMTLDSMRGICMTPSTGSNDAVLKPNLSNAEATDNIADLTATGFTFSQSASSTYIYIAIRRGPMKTPTTATSVFVPSTASGVIQTGFTVDSLWGHVRGGTTTTPYTYDRLRGGTKFLVTSSTAAENTGSSVGFETNNGLTVSFPSNYVDYFFQRAPGFFDVVCYTGTGSATTVSHNLGAVPEFIIVRNRSNATPNWQSYHSALGNTQIVQINTTNAASTASTVWNDTTPTSSVFTVGTNAGVNTSSENYVAYLFASCPGVSKIGTYTGNGSSVTVTTNFQPRFIMVKRTDSTGDWIVSDSARGLVAGNDPYLRLNSNAAEVTNEDWVDVSSTSFTVNQTTASNANVNTGTYIYLAIA